MKNKLEELIARYRSLGIDQQLNYDKFYLYSIITHSTAIEGSTITELENQIMFDDGISIKGKSLVEQNMNLDLKAAYELTILYAKNNNDITVDRLKELSALAMKNTGTVYHTMLGDFSSANGDLRLLNVTAGIGGKSYMNFNKVPTYLEELCNELNLKRRLIDKSNIQELYNLSFDAHFKLVTIHPWADGNGRMARLLMNWIQFEFNLIPSRIFADDKEDYIKSLVETREKDDLSIFRQFMTETTIRYLTNEIDAFEQSIDSHKPIAKTTSKTADIILSLLAKNPNHTATTLAKEIGITTKGVEKQLSRLRSEGKIRHIGPNKGGYWQISV